MSTNEKSTHGFILPYVLVYLFVMSAVTAVAFQSYLKTAQDVFSLERRINTDIALKSAEAESVFILLNAKPARTGFELGLSEEVPAKPQTEVESGGSSIDYWNADGAVRRSLLSKVDVCVKLRSIEGLVSLNSGSGMDLIPFLTNSGINKNEADEMIAKMLDYRDSDSKRRFLGAEAVNYKVKRMNPPSNLPYLSFKELTDIMGWGEYFVKNDIRDLVEVATLQKTDGVVSRFVHPSLNYSKKVGSTFDDLMLNAGIVSSQIRLTFIAPCEAGRNSTHRIIEYDLGRNYGDRPFRSYFVYEFTGRNELEINDEFQSVYN